MITRDKLSEFLLTRDKLIKELAEVLNRNSVDNCFDTPDFILAEYVWLNLESMAIMETKKLLHAHGEILPSMPPYEIEG